MTNKSLLPEYKREASKKYYDNNKEKCNRDRLKRQYMSEFGRDFVNLLYEKYDDNTSKIKAIIKIKRACKILDEPDIDVIINSHKIVTVN